MKLLLDTHILLWALLDDPALGASRRAALEDPESALYLSAASIWEISIKRALGKLDVPDAVFDAATQGGCQPLPILWTHARAAGELPAHHNDPFDRMLIAQAQIEGMTLLTADRAFTAYDVPTL